MSLLKDFSDFDLDSCSNAIGGPSGQKEHIRNVFGLVRLDFFCFRLFNTLAGSPAYVQHKKHLAVGIM